MFRSQMRQLCRKCKGTGTTDQDAVDRDGQVIVAPPYQKGEAERLVKANCKECKGSGWAMYDAPSEIMQDGQKIKLDEEARRSRFQDTLGV